jgi:protein-disulfide isomerase
VLNNNRVITVAMLLSTACAAAVTGLVLKQSYDRHAAKRAQMPQRVDNWGDLIATGHKRVGKNSLVTIVDFSDFECPFCAKFERTVMPALEAKYGEQLTVVRRHWPLDFHENAYAAARAAECAARQNRYFEYAAVLYRQQKLIGAKSFGAFARDAGVSDTTAFDACAADTAPVDAVEKDRNLALKSGAAGTPAIFVDGWRLYDTSAQSVDSAVDAAIRRRIK